MDFVKWNPSQMEPITKGWSGDRKYCVSTEDGTRYLLRISPMEKREKREGLFGILNRGELSDVPMCRSVAIEVREDGVYTLHTWIDGADAEDVIPMMPEADQYRYGLEAGRILGKIHSIPAPEGVTDWETRFNRKMDYKIQKYGECPIHYENGQAFIDYIGENRHLLHGRGQVFQHGDYHIGNMMIDRGGKLQIIDFDRYDFGDPWEEFNRIVWCAEKAPVFASGMVDGYFGGDVPLEFWRLLAMYIASNTLSSVYWAIPFGEGEVRTMLNQGHAVLTWYDGMRNVVPAWYCGVYI